jgi:hypothetical protein
MRGLAVVLALTGCNELYGLEPTTLAPELDADGDLVRDVDDNCISVANPDQADADSDSIGNGCDNCPLIANPSQELTGDSDLVGDFCDPHPLTDGDCLVVFDSFADPSTFATSWRVVSNEATPRVGVSAGEVALTPAHGMGGIAFVALATDSTPLTGRYDVQFRARGTLTAYSGGAAAVSSLTTVQDGYRCQLYLQQEVEYFALALREPLHEMAAGGLLSSTPVDDAMVVRLVSQTETGERVLRCRADYGAAVGASNSSSPVMELTGGSPGVLAMYDPLTVDAVAIYHYQPGSACAESIRR